MHSPKITTIEQLVEIHDMEQWNFYRRLADNTLFENRTAEIVCQEPFRCHQTQKNVKATRKRPKKVKPFIGIDYTTAEKREVRKSKEEKRLKTEQLKTTKQDVADRKQATITSFFRPIR
jgi:hypothetical protein